MLESRFTQQYGRRPYIQVNQGRLSGALLKEMPVLAESGLWNDLVRCVERAFDVDPPAWPDPVSGWTCRFPRPKR